MLCLHIALQSLLDNLYAAIIVSNLTHPYRRRQDDPKAALFPLVKDDGTVGVPSCTGFLVALFFCAFCEMEFSRCNCSIAAGFVLAWTSIGRLGLRAKLAGTGHLHPEFFHLVHSSRMGNLIS